MLRIMSLYLQFEYIYDFELLDLTEEDWEKAEEELVSQSFLDPFTVLLENPNSLQILSSLSYESREGIYTFKVTILEDSKAWRKIAIGSERSAEDLHLAIQKAYDFGNDHLYAFYLVGWDNYDYAVMDPRGGDGVDASEFKISDIRIYEGDTIGYLFDFGDDWRFDVTLEKIEEGNPSKSAVIVESKGEAPEQYPDYDDEDDDELYF